MALQALPSALTLAQPEEYIASLKRLLVVLERRKNTGKNESKEEAALIATTAAWLSLSMFAEDMNEPSSQFDAAASALAHMAGKRWDCSQSQLRHCKPDRRSASLPYSRKIVSVKLATRAPKRSKKVETPPLSLIIVWPRIRHFVPDFINSIRGTLSL